MTSTKSNFTLDSDNYYEILNGTFRDSLEDNNDLRNYGSPYTFIRGCLVLLLRVGFVLIQLGSVPIENVYIIVLQNVVDLAVSITCFGLVGFIIAFGNDGFDGVVGYNKWIASESADLDDTVFGFCACIIATGIITTILSGRIHFVGYLLINMLFAMLMQPLVMHWVWHEDGWMHRQHFLGYKVSVKDHAGGLVIHVSAGVVGLIGAFFLGRRLLKLSDIDESSIGAESPGSTLMGYVFIILGLLGFSLPLPKYEVNHIPYNYVALVLINNIMAMASGIVVVVILQFLFFREPFNYWVVLRCMQGAVAGIVAISSGIDVYSPIFAYIAGSATAVLFYFVIICMNNTSIEDYCNVTATHLVCGIISVLLPPIFGTKENLGQSVTAQLRIIHLGWQLVCLFIVIGVLLIIFTVLYLMIFFTGFLRNKSEEINHRRAMTVAVRGPQRCCLQRLFVWHSGIPYIEPGIHGKSPEQYHSYQMNNFTFRENSQGSTNTKDDKRSTLELEESTKISNTGEKRTPEKHKNQRFVYTLSTITDSPFQATTQHDIFDNPNCTGDITKSEEMEQSKQECEDHYFVEKINEMNSLVEKRHSGHKLHRTKKQTNLVKSKLAKCKRNLKLSLQDMPKSALIRSPDCILHDNFYDDGIVTLKMAHSEDMADLSDATDSS